MRFFVLLSSLLIVGLAMTPEEEACAAPLMKQLANEKDKELKQFVMKCFKLVNAGKRDEVMVQVKKFNKEKMQKFMDDYMSGPCEIFRKEFEEL
ncbi:hypothetical protein PMAYCL1PPCAC_12882 [Pristionchus mayeri]|uniref:Uncharacterized protein n=1 Tax=Pristionchus mayeri TaxID=1317129 RepID=A0AAN4ZQP1_9BILA|nr:hypothetical protein PMAYCL1PPCAC_12882 [Pristionchus mayeri]